MKSCLIYDHPSPKYNMRWKDIITEAAQWVATIKGPSSYADGMTFEVFKNPSVQDINKELGGEARMFLLGNGDILYWNEGLLHNEVAHELKISEDNPHLSYATRKRKQIWWGEVERYKLDHAWDIRLDFDNDEKYYDGRLRDDYLRVVSNPNLIRLCGGTPVIMGIDEDNDIAYIDAAWIERNVETDS